MGVFIEVAYYGQDGKIAGPGSNVYLPEYLDWLPIEAKVFWFLERGLGEPLATHVLFKSQGEQLLATLTQPLRHMTHKELQENENGIEGKVDRYITSRGISRTPRNQ